MISIPDELLPPCTVRISVQGEHAGSGFFVAPQMVATAAHVIESQADTTRPVDDREISVVGRDGNEHEVKVHRFAGEPDGDLAVLKLRAAVSHRCVLLDSAPVFTLDKMATFAYTKDHLEGFGRTMNADGRTGKGVWALGHGEVESGMSGAPLLNLRTGGVCGVINRTRRLKTDLGGFALPIANLLALEKSLRVDNERYHQRATEWLQALNPDQQSGWHAARVRAIGDAPRFVVTLDETDHGWRVTAEDPEGVRLPEVPVDLNAVKSEVARLFRDWAALHPRVDEDDQVMLLGRILFSAAFPKAIGERLIELMTTHESERVLVCVRFDPGLDREFRELPWEHLCLPKPHDIYMATDARLSFARVPGTFEGQPPPATAAPLPLLLAAVRPEEVGSGTSAAEVVRDRLIQTATSSEGLALTPLLHPDAWTLGQALAADHPPVLHYVGFGLFQKNVDRIALGAGPEEVEYEPVETLVGILPDPPPALVVLEQCGPSPKPVSTDFSVLAPALLDAGVSAVVAFQYLMPAHHTGLFNDAFYRALLDGELIEFAVQAGRAKVKQYRHTFVSPTLFVRRPGELRLIAPGGTGSGSGEPPRGGAFAVTDA